MARQPGGRAPKVKGREDIVRQVRRTVADHGLRAIEIFPELEHGTGQAVAANPCAQESAGLLICNGTDQEVVPFPAGGPYRLVVNNGVVTFENAGGNEVEAAPAPRGSGVHGGEPTGD